MSSDIRALVERFQKGDQQAFTELVNRFKKTIYAVAYRRLKNHLDADEVTQETFVRVYKKIGELKSSQNFRSYIIRIALNFCTDLIRRRKKLVPVDELTSQSDMSLSAAGSISSPERNLENAEIISEIEDAIEWLPPKQKMAFILHDLEGFSKSEVAKIMNCPQATVRSNLHIARTKLKKWLAKKFQ